MKFETDGRGISTDMPNIDLVCLRPTGNGEWVLGLGDFAAYGDDGDAEGIIRRQIFDLVEADRAEWVTVALRDAIREHGPGSTAPETFGVIPGGVS